MYKKEQTFLGYEVQIISLLLVLRIEAGTSNLDSLFMLNMHATLPEPLYLWLLLLISLDSIASAIKQKMTNSLCWGSAKWLFLSPIFWGLDSLGLTSWILSKYFLAHLCLLIFVQVNPCKSLSFSHLASVLSFSSGCLSLHLLPHLSLAEKMKKLRQDKGVVSSVHLREESNLMCFSWRNCGISWFRWK